MRFGAYEQIVDWIKDSKEWLDAQYFNKTVKGQWNDDWNKTMGSESKVFAFSGVTTKHFACNNQEDNRMGVDACVSERALREIYFRGFEIAVKKSAPVSIMTSYNLINGVHAANSRDLCTVVVREEWGGGEAQSCLIGIQQFRRMEVSRGKAQLPETTLLCREIQMMMQIFGMHMKKDCIRKEKSEAARAELLQ